MKILIKGYGSIGRRHGNILSALGHEIFYVSRQNRPGPFFTTLEKAFKAHEFGYIIIATETCRHHGDLMSLRNFSGPILIEKPVFHHPVKSIFKNPGNIFVGYNMRFNPLIKYIKGELENQRILSAVSYVGQFLPQWRPDIDYRSRYSAVKSLGGGVLRDLSHELDFLTWILGRVQGKVVAKGGHVSSLEIDTEDLAMALFSTQKCPNVSMTLTYLDKSASRFLIINTETCTYTLDFIKKSIVKNGQTTLFSWDRDDTYREMHQAILTGRNKRACTFEQGLEVLNIIGIMDQQLESEGIDV